MNTFSIAAPSVTKFNVTNTQQVSKFNLGSSMTSDLSNYVQKFNDFGDVGTTDVVGMLALKLWDDAGEVYRDLDLVGNQLNFDGDPVALMDNGSQSLRAGGLVIYDNVGDGDYLLTADNTGLIFNGNKVVTNVHNVNTAGTQRLEFVNPLNQMCSFFVSSQDLNEGFAAIELTLNAEEGFAVSQGSSQIAVGSSGATFSHYPYNITLSAQGYSVTNPTNFRKAIKAPSKFHIFALGGI